ncbi:MAG TPA: hypothetical protein VIP56_08725, partial [Nitrososphaeraceae archaeon]
IFVSITRWTVQWCFGCKIMKVSYYKAGFINKKVQHWKVLHKRKNCIQDFITKMTIVTSKLVNFTSY